MSSLPFVDPNQCDSLVALRSIDDSHANKRELEDNEGLRPSLLDDSQLTLQSQGEILRQGFLGLALVQLDYFKAVFRLVISLD